MFRLVDADEDTDVQRFMVLLRNINAMTVVCLHQQDLQVKLLWTPSPLPPTPHIIQGQREKSREGGVCVYGARGKVPEFRPLLNMKNVE